MRLLLTALLFVGMVGGFAYVLTEDDAVALAAGCMGGAFAVWMED